MLCRHPYVKDPNVSWSDLKGNVSRYRSIKEARLAGTPFPCGQCLHCRINQARVWTHRILLETLNHADSLWITLSYNQENLPPPPRAPSLEHLTWATQRKANNPKYEYSQLQKTDVQKWLKKVRKETPKFRYFIVGEYGTKYWRPHYHCCIFGLSEIYVQLLYNKWAKCDPERFDVGKIEEASARYTAGYTTSKLTKRKEFKVNGLAPEFMLSSRRGGGIGYNTIIEVAKKYGTNKFRERTIVRDLRNGKVSRPLGRYLTVKLAEKLGVPEKQFDQEYWIHQEEIFQKHLGKEDYYEELVAESQVEAITQEKKFKLYKKREF